MRSLLAIVCLVIGALGPACSRSADSADSARGVSTAPSAAPEPPLAGRPVRIVPANVAAAEFFAPLVGPERLAALPEQVVAYSALLEEDPRLAALPRFGHYRAEDLVALRPDLVVTIDWQVGEATKILRDHAIPVLVLSSATSYARVRSTVELCARIAGEEERGARWIEELDRRVAALREGAPRRAHLSVLVYSNTGTGGWVPGRDTTAEAVIDMVGMHNVAVEHGLELHARVDFESLLAMAPDVIVANELVAEEAGSATVSILRSSPALAALPAIREGRILVLPPRLLSADSPRLVDAAEHLAAEVDRRLAEGTLPAAFDAGRTPPR